MSILTRSHLRFHFRHPVLLLLTLLGITLGIAIVVGIQLLTRAATDSLEQSMTQIQGANATHHLRSTFGAIPEMIYAELKRSPLYGEATPIFEGSISISGASAQPRVVKLMGLDPFSNPQFPFPLAWPSDPEKIRVLASRDLNLKEGEVFYSPQCPHPLIVWKVLPVSGKLLITDVEFARKIPVVRFDRIELQWKIENLDALRSWAKSRNLRLDPVESSLEGQKRMMGSFQLGLRALSFLALLVGMFLIYNTMSFAVELRKPHFGTLRLIGVTRREIFTFVSLEAVVFGCVGGLGGILLGRQLAEVFLNQVLQTVNDLYFSTSPSPVRLEASDQFLFLSIGILAAGVASALPALDAMLSPPRISLAQSMTEEKFKRFLRNAVPPSSLASIALGILILNFFENEIALFMALLALIVGGALWIPRIILVMTRVALAGMPQGAVLLRLAMDSTLRHLSRTGIAVTALSIAFAVSLGMDQMVTSFRAEMSHWLETYVHADLYAAPHGYSTGQSDVVIPPDLVNALISRPEIADWSSQRHVVVESDRGPLRLVSLRPSGRVSSLFPVLASNKGFSWTQMSQGTTVAISEALSHRLNLKINHMITLTTPQGPKTYVIGAIFKDYVTDQGLLFMEHSEYLRTFRDEHITTMHFFLKDTNNLEGARKAFLEIPNLQDALRITTQSQVKDGSLEVFDRTFQITQSLRALAVLISMIGLFSALMAIQLSRTYEVGIQRALGLLPKEIFVSLLIQNAWLGLLTSLLALPLSQLIAWFLGSVLNPISFGWTIPTSISPRQTAITCMLILLSSLIAGLYPAFKISRISLAQTLKEKSEI